MYLVNIFRKRWWIACVDVYRYTDRFNIVKIIRGTIIGNPFCIHNTVTKHTVSHEIDNLSAKTLDTSLCFVLQIVANDL